MYLSAAMGWPVATLLICPLPVDLPDRLLSLPPRALVAENSHGPAFLHIPCAVSASVAFHNHSQLCLQCVKVKSKFHIRSYYFP